MIWIEFIICTAVIVFSGTRMSRLGDAIAAKTGMGRTWVGVILMATVTSLPELITGLSSVTAYNLPNIAVGDVLGSCMFNLFILASLDLHRTRDPISSVAHQGHVLTAAFGVLLLGIAAVGIVGARLVPSLAWVGLTSVIILPLYVLGMRMVFRYEKRSVAAYLAEVAGETPYDHVSKARVYGQFVANAAVIVAAATYLPHVADAMAASTGLGQTFVGSIFVAFSTSLPEIVVSREALRIGAVDLAVGNILGSNLSDIAILAVDDVFYRKGPLLGHASASHAVTAVGAMIMTAVTIIAIVYRSKRRAWLFSWESMAIYFAYALTSLLLFLMR